MCLIKFNFITFNFNRQLIKTEIIFQIKRMFFRYIPLEEAVKILYIKTNKLPEAMSEQCRFTQTHNVETIENYGINLISNESEDKVISLYGINANSAKFEEIPSIKIKYLIIQKIENSNNYGLYIDNIKQKEYLQYTNLAIKAKSLSKIIKKYKNYNLN